MRRPWGQLLGAGLLGLLGSSPVLGFDLVNSGAEGLSPQCAAVVGKLQAGMQSGDPVAASTVLEALHATGRVIEGLYIVNMGAKAPPPTPEQQKLALLNLVTGYPWVSLGNADACKYIVTDKGAAADFQYCHVDIAGAFIRYGVCVPSVCNADDVALGLNATFLKVTKQPLDPSVQLAPVTVCGEPGYPYVTGTYVMIAVTLLLLVLVALGTTVEHLRLRAAASSSASGAPTDLASPGRLLDLEQPRWFQRDTLLLNVLLCFSLIKNWKLLMAKARGGPFDSLDGIRTLSMGWVIFGHTMIFALFGISFSNSASYVLGKDGKGWLTRYSAQALTGGYFAVDTFFFISAFLAVYLMLEQLHRLVASKGTALPFLGTIPKIYVLRFVRLTPAYFYVVLMYWFVMRLAGSGPFWMQQLESDYRMCSNGWWWNLLYLNNLITQENNGMRGQSCYPVSWYLAVDFQLFLLTPFVALLALWNHLVALVLLVVATVLSMVLGVVYAYKGEWSIDFLDQSTYFADYYITPWFRAPPYLMGMILAVVWFYHYRGTTRGLLPSLVGRVRRDRLFVYSLLSVSFVLMGLTVYGAQGAYTDNPPPWSRELMSVYIGLSKPAWTAGLALLCYLLFLGEGGLLKAFFECRAFTVLSRLTYCAYLIHPAVIYWTYGELLGPIHFSDEWYAFTYVGVLASVMAISAAVHLMVERPVANLERLLRGADRGRSSKAAGAGHKDFAKAEQVAAHRANGSADDEVEEDDDGVSELGKPLLADEHRQQQQGRAE